MSALAIKEYEAFHTTEAQRHQWVPERTTGLDRKPLLDNPSDPHPLLTALMDEALLRIILVSDGAVMALKERTTGGHAGTRAPSSDLATIVQDLDLRFERCKTHRRRLEVILQAQTTADRLRYAPDRSIVQGTPEWRATIAQDSRPCRVVANVYGVSKDTVRRIKKEAGTLAKRGRPKNGARLVVIGKGA